MLSGQKQIKHVMKKIFGILAIVVATLSLTGCGVSMMSSENFNQTKVVLSEKNFNVIGQAYGESSATYICGIGGLSQKALRANAIDEMSRNARLKGAQTLTNITTHMSVKMVTPFYVKVTCSATANIVEFK